MPRQVWSDVSINQRMDIIKYVEDRPYHCNINEVCALFNLPFYIYYNWKRTYEHVKVVGQEVRQPIRPIVSPRPPPIPQALKRVIENPVPEFQKYEPSVLLKALIQELKRRSFNIVLAVQVNDSYLIEINGCQLSFERLLAITGLHAESKFKEKAYVGGNHQIVQEDGNLRTDLEPVRKDQTNIDTIGNTSQPIPIERENGFGENTVAGDAGLRQVV